jgi:ABC-2 type transport system ATP-binding protein
MISNPALLLDSVSKRYADHHAVHDLHLSVPQGTIYGILGPNGAGKSTTLRMVMNIIARDAGRILLLGRDPAADRDVIRRVGYLPEERGLYKKMKVIEVIVFFARLKGAPRDTVRRDAEAWLDRMGLGEWRDAKVETLSKGMQQKVQFITTVLHNPDVLILDEPQSGLDPVNQEVLRDTILDAARQGRTVIFSTHNMDQAEQLCEHVCIIAHGQKVLDGKLREVRRAHRTGHYAIEWDEPSEVAERFVEGNPWFTRADQHGAASWEVELAPSADSQELLAKLAALGPPLRRFEYLEPSLHEIFVSKVGNAAQPERNPEAARV